MSTFVHELKTHPRQFLAVADGSKPFEVRWNDRHFQTGDQVLLREFDQSVSCSCVGRHHASSCRKYSGRTITAGVGFVVAHSASAFQGKVGFDGRGYVVFGLIRPQLLTDAADVAASAPAAVAAGSTVSVTPADIAAKQPRPATIGGA